MIDWDAISKEDLEIVIKIANRAIKNASVPLTFDVNAFQMDITACHLSNPLKLQELLDAPRGDFAHDVWGIYRHLDRETGLLTDCFSPRYSVPQKDLV